MYHALEDAPKMTSSSGSKSRNRRGRNGGGWGADAGKLAADAAQQRVQAVPRPLQSSAYQAPAPQLPQYLCQMMPTMETSMAPLGTLGAPPYGGHLLGTGPQWIPYVGFHPPAPVVMGSRGAAPIQLPQHVPSSYMVLPQPSNPQPPAPPSHIQAAIGVAAESEFAPLAGSDLLMRHIL